VSFLRHVVERAAVDPTGAEEFAAGFVVDMRRHSIDVAAETSIGHVGFLRTALLYAEPSTGFCFAGVQRAVDFNAYDDLPQWWSEVVSAARQLLLDT
jgi:hypothetical protein